MLDRRLQLQRWATSYCPLPATLVLSPPCVLSYTSCYCPLPSLRPLAVPLLPFTAAPSPLSLCPLLPPVLSQFPFSTSYYCSLSSCGLFYILLSFPHSLYYLPYATVLSCHLLPSIVLSTPLHLHHHSSPSSPLTPYTTNTTDQRQMEVHNV